MKQKLKVAEEMDSKVSRRAKWEEGDIRTGGDELKLRESNGY